MTLTRQPGGFIKPVPITTDEPRLADSLGIPSSGKVHALNHDDPAEEQQLNKLIKDGYGQDPLTRSVLVNPDHHKRYFRMSDGLIWTKNFRGQEVVCVPRESSLTTRILTKAHEIVGHYGDQRTCEYVRRWYWWPQMSKLTSEFCKTCEACQRSKGLTQRPAGKLHSLPVPTKPWDSIGMDFVGPFPESRGFNYLWVVICRMISMVHLIPVTIQVTASELLEVYARGGKATWPTQFDRKRPRLEIYFTMVEGAPTSIGSKATHVDLLPSTNGRAIRTCDSQRHTDPQDRSTA